VNQFEAIRRSGQIGEVRIGGRETPVVGYSESRARVNPPPHDPPRATATAIRHSFIYVASNVMTGAVGLVTTMALTRLLTPTSYGVYGLGFALIGFAGTIFFDWHSMSFLRFGGGGGDREEILGTFVLLLASLMGVAAGIVALFYLAGLAPSYEPIMWVGVIGACTAGWFQFIVRVQVAELRPKRIFWMNLVRALMTLVLSLATAYLTKNAIYVLAATAAGPLVGAVIFPLRGLRVGRMKFSRPLARTVIAFGYPVAISMTIAGVGGVVSRFMLDHLASIEAVGRFTAATFAVQNVLTLLSYGIGQATYPLAVKAVESKDPVVLHHQLTMNFTLTFGTLLPAAVGLSLVAPNLVPLMVGPAFVDAVIALTPWLATAAVLGGIRAQYFDYSFQLGRKTGYLIFILTTTVVLNVGLNVSLIPRYGEFGCAMALVFALALSLALALVLSPRAFPMPIPLKASCQVVLASLLMAGAMTAVSPLRGSLGLIVQIAVGAAVYAASLIAVNFMGVRSQLPFAIKEISGAVQRWRRSSSG
jgi:O-antigen/teichoic acid export membrane protein